ncbi:hypothetical protein B0T16DRAFT_454749 [Cercophora newfieldiana]|uniref:Uncharacterized protein n=1 Tax=Cercophora newfieldiana TaxID=92897 RepID=A0AA39YIY0_9PEZI|nr:hypothetical protein B0T16DRAFT_454749 [Cercophora newfieldiana]
MSSLFCCSFVRPFRPVHLNHEDKFRAFMAWAEFPKESSPATGQDVDTVRADLGSSKPPFAVQLVRQVNYGPLESKRYFVPVKDEDNEFVEIGENDLIQANFQKLNSYKNFGCQGHNRFFEVSVYQRDPVKHRWRVNIARPGSSIDL